VPLTDTEITAIRWVPCFNAGSSQIPAAAPVQVVSVALSDDRAVLQVAQIGSGSYAAFNPRIAFNGPLAIGPGMYGACTDGAFVQCLWDTGTPTPGDIWGIKPGQYSLTKNGVGNFVVDGIVDAGTRRMFGRWYGIESLLGKVASGSISYSTSGTVNVWSGAAGSEAVTSGPWTVTAYNRLAKVGTTAMLVLKLIGGSWYIVGDNTAYVLEGTLGGDCASSTSSVTVGSLTAVTPGVVPVSSTITANNDFGLAALSGAKCLVVGDGNTWVLQEVARTVQTFVTRVTWDGTNLNQYTRDVVGMSNNSEQGPTVIDTATACPS
jgi:hypothetical protein